MKKLFLIFLSWFTITQPMGYLKSFFKVHPKFTQSQAFLANRLKVKHMGPTLEKEAIHDIVDDVTRSTFREFGQFLDTNECLKAVSDKIKQTVGIVNQFLEIEKKESKTHIFAYHGVAGIMNLIQDLNRELYKKQNPDVVIPKDYIFFRNPQSYVATDHAIDLKNCRDTDSEIRKILLSASLNCFDTAKNESALHFFASNSSAMLLAHPCSMEFLNLLKSYKINDQLLSRLIECYKKQPASFVQIMLPRDNKDLINTCTYVSEPYGKKYNTNLLTDQFIDEQRQNPESIEPGFQQLRIILASKYFANPSSGVKMNCFSLRPKDCVAEYHKEQLLKEALEFLK